MDWHSIVAEYGIYGLGGASFVSATLLPLSSEAILLAGISAGIPVGSAFAACSVGNCLACLLNYWLGVLMRSSVLAKLHDSRSGRKAIAWMERWGTLSLLGSWLPFVGDPLTLVAGTVKVRLWWFVGIVCSLRVLRYVATLYGAQAAHIVSVPF
jgi:membrane protein YqaA with SNARE-associated domain